MTISASTSRVVFNCDGISTVFPVPIQAYVAADFEVILTAPSGGGGAETKLILNSDYSMAQSGTMNPQQWVLTTLGAIPYAAGYTLQTILRPVQTQQSQYVQGQAFPSAAVQANLDRLTQMVQALQDQVNRALIAPDGDVTPGMALPSAPARALMYQAYDANGNSLLTAALPGTANTAASLGPILNPRTPPEIGAGAFPTNYLYSAVGTENADVRRYGGVGDGATSDTAAFTTALNILSNAVMNACRTAASWLVGAVNLALPAILQGGGKVTLSGASAGFKLNANMAGPAFRDIEVQGDGVLGNVNKAVWADSTKTISGIKIIGCYVHGCVQNIDVEAMTDGAIIGNRIDSALGNAAGQGYGIVGPVSGRIAILGNTLFNNGRHSIYQSSVNYNVLVGNISYRNAGIGSSAAFVISRRATGVAVTGNVLAEYNGAGMTIDSDNAEGIPGINRAIQVVGQIFYQAPGSTNVNSDLAIGSSNPSTGYLVQSIAVRSCSFTPSPVRQNGFIVVTNGFNLDISDNLFDAYLGTAAGQIAINLDTTSGGAYYDKIRICGNTGVLASSGGATTFVNIGTAICTGTQQVDIFNNTVTCGALISYQTPPTNPNIRHDAFIANVVALPLGAADMNIAGYYDFVLSGNAGGSTINNVTNAYAGKVITLRFTDALVTLTRTNCELAGGVNFVSASHAMLVLKFLGGVWYEISRSLDG